MEWIKEFDDEFPELHIAHGAFSAEGEPLYIDERDRLKDFITTQITKERNKTLEETAKALINAKETGPLITGTDDAVRFIRALKTTI